MTVLDCLLKNVDSLGVWQANESFLQHTFKTLDETLVNHLVQELKVIAAVVKCPAYAILYEVFLQVHQFFLIDECNLWFHHPELCKVTRSVTVLGTERRTEGVDCSQRSSAEFTLQLSTNGKRCLLSEEVIVVDDASVLVLLQVIEILRCHLEHVTGTLAIACGDEWRVEIEESMLMKICVYCHRHIVADAHNCPKGICTQAHVSVLTHLLERLSFLLHGVIVTAETINLYTFAMDF